jgi:SPP1 family predicted phage head-tail adaptor
MNKIHNNFGDGVVCVYKEKEKISSFGAAKNIKNIDELTFIVKLNYEELSFREQDLEYAKINGRRATLKIKTPNYKDIEKSYKALIGDILYDIYYTDSNKKKDERFFHLERMFKIAK